MKFKTLISNTLLVALMVSTVATPVQAGFADWKENIKKKFLGFVDKASETKFGKSVKETVVKHELGKIAKDPSKGTELMVKGFNAILPQKLEALKASDGTDLLAKAFFSVGLAILLFRSLSNQEGGIGGFFNKMIVEPGKKMLGESFEAMQKAGSDMVKNVVSDATAKAKEGLGEQALNTMTNLGGSTENTETPKNEETVSYPNLQEKTK